MQAAVSPPSVALMLDTVHSLLLLQQSHSNHKRPTMENENVLSLEIAKALIPVSDKFDKDFHIDADGKITEIDRSAFPSYAEGLSPESGLLTCASNQCTILYTPCGGRQTTFCLNKGASETRRSETYQNGQIVCTSLTYTC